MIKFFIWKAINNPKGFFLVNQEDDSVVFDHMSQMHLVGSTKFPATCLLAQRSMCE